MHIPLIASGDGNFNFKLQEMMSQRDSTLFFLIRFLLPDGHHIESHKVKYTFVTRT